MKHAEMLAGITCHKNSKKWWNCW